MLNQQTVTNNIADKLIFYSISRILMCQEYFFGHIHSQTLNILVHTAKP